MRNTVVKNVWRFLTVLIAFALSTPLAERACALPVARLRNLEPQVQVRIEGRGEFMAARERATLRYGDIVRTDARGRAEVLFSNGTRVAMREKSQIQIVAPARKDSPLVIRVFGALSEVFVRPKGNTQIKTAAAIAAARGTAFLVRLPDENTAVVTVTEDEVDFWNGKGRVLLAANQQSTAKVGVAPTPPVAVDASGLAAWTAGIAGLPVEFETPFQTPDPNAARKLLAARPAPTDTASRLDYGRLLYDAGEYSSAAAQFAAATDAEPQNLEAWLALGRAQRGQGDAAGSQRSFERALQIDKTSTSAHIGLALAHLARNDFDGARAALQAVRDEPQAQAVAGLIALYGGDYNGAETTLRAALEKRDAFYQAHALLALALLSQDKREPARAQARRAVELQPNSAQAQGTLGMALFFSGREYSRDAMKAADRAVELNPLSPFALLVQGRTALADGDVDEARNAFGQAAALAPDLEITHTELAAAYLRQGHISSAEKEYHRALAINAKSAAARAGLGQVLARQGKTEPARAAFEQAIALDTNDPTARAAYAAFLIEQGHLDEARVQLDKGVVAAPDRGILYTRLSEVSLLRQKIKDAEQYALKAVSLLPDSALTHYQLGRVYLELERATQAVQEFRLAVILDREFAEARYALGYARELVETGRDPSRPVAAAGAGALNSASRAVNLQNLQTPGAEDRLQAAIQDPTVVRTASRSYGDTELSVVAGQNGVLNGTASHIELSKDRRGVFGLTAQRESSDEVNDLDNSDTTDNRYSVIFGRKAKNNPSSFFVMGDYESIDEGLNKGDQPPTAVNLRDEARKPRLILGANWQKNNNSRTRALLQYSKPEVETRDSFFGDSQDADLKSFNAEIRHDRRMGRDHYLSAGLFAGKRQQDLSLLLAGLPPFLPDQRFMIGNNIRTVGGYIRDEYQQSKRFSLIGELKIQKIEGDSSFQQIAPLPTPPMKFKLSRTEALPTLIAEYHPNAYTGVRLRMRRVFGGLRDFQLLSPTDVFLSPLDDLPQLAAIGSGMSYELEGDHTFRNGSLIHVGVFEMRLQNVQEPTSDFSGAILPHVRLRGLRAGYEGTLSRDVSFFLRSGYTQARDRDGGDQIANVPRWTGEAGLQYLNDAGWFVQPSFYYQSDRRRVNDTMAGGFGVLKLRAGKRFGLRSVVFAEVLNLTNRKYDILEVEQPGRQYRVGIIGRF